MSDKPATVRTMPEVALWILLDSCAAFGVKPPESTGHIKVSGELCRYIAEVELAVEGQALDAGAVHAAFGGLAVKQAFHLVRDWAAKIEDLMERDLAIRRYGAKRVQRTTQRGGAPWGDDRQTRQAG